MLAKQKDEGEDFISDQRFLLLKIASLAGVDAQADFDRTMVEYDGRFRLGR